MNRKLYWFAAVIVAGSTVALILLLSSPRRVHDSVTPAAAQGNLGQVTGAVQKATIESKRSGALPFAGGNDPGSRILALLSSSGEERSKGLDDAIQAWVAQDAVGAAEFGESQESVSVREEMLHRVLEAWSRKDAKAALAWANDLTDPAKKQEAVSAICLTMAQLDPLKALDSALDSHAENAGDGLIESIAMQWAAKDPQAARQWAEAQDPGAWRDGVMGRIAFVLCRTDPAGAAQIVSSEMQPGQAQTEAAISVVHQWAKVDQASATAWVNGFPAELRKRALTEIANEQSGLY
ncbi:MAG TPA: hypothetical protein VIM48_08720 [Chthoniobacterales bacterium]